MQSTPSILLPHAQSGAALLRKLNRNVLIVASVVLFHGATLWALHTGLLRRVVEVVVPLEMLSQVITPQLPRTDPKPAAPPAPRVAESLSRPRDQQVERPLAPAPQPQAVSEATPALDAATGVLVPQPAPPPLAVSDSARPAPAPAPAKIELPSSAASYLQNPTPVYPAISKRLGEQGKVLVRGRRASGADSSWLANASPRLNATMICSAGCCNHSRRANA